MLSVRSCEQMGAAFVVSLSYILGPFHTEQCMKMISLGPTPPMRCLLPRSDASSHDIVSPQVQDAQQRLRALLLELHHRTRLEGVRVREAIKATEEATTRQHLLDLSQKMSEQEAYVQVRCLFFSLRAPCFIRIWGVGHRVSVLIF